MPIITPDTGSFNTIFCLDLSDVFFDYTNIKNNLFLFKYSLSKVSGNYTDMNYNIQSTTKGNISAYFNYGVSYPFIITTNHTYNGLHSYTKPRIELPFIDLYKVTYLEASTEPITIVNYDISNNKVYFKINSLTEGLKKIAIITKTNNVSNFAYAFFTYNTVTSAVTVTPSMGSSDSIYTINLSACPTLDIAKLKLTAETPNTIIDCINYNKHSKTMTFRIISSVSGTKSFLLTDDIASYRFKTMYEYIVTKSDYRK